MWKSDYLSLIVEIRT